MVAFIDDFFALFSRTNGDLSAIKEHFTNALTNQRFPGYLQSNHEFGSLQDLVDCRKDAKKETRRIKDLSLADKVSFKAVLNTIIYVFVYKISLYIFPCHALKIQTINA